MACGTQLSDQGSNLGPFDWECGGLATGPPEKPADVSFIALVFFLLF